MPNNYTLKWLTKNYRQRLRIGDGREFNEFSAGTKVQ